MLTRMTIRQQEDELFAEWSAGRPSFHRDGVVDEDAYLASTTRLLFVLKEVHAPPDSSGDLRAWLHDHERGKMWSNVARWVAAIRVMEGDSSAVPAWESYSAVGEEGRRRHLRSIAAVNIKKSAGAGRASMPDVRREALRDRLFIARQLDLYAPHVVVCCGEFVGDFVKAHVASYGQRTWRRATRQPDAAVAPRASVYTHLHPAMPRSPRWLAEPLVHALHAGWFRAG